MTLEEINELEKELEQAREKLEDYKNALLEQELKDKQHKSLSDYRCYEKLKDGEKYKTFDKYNEIMEEIWSSADLNIAQFKIGNVYSIDTPNELLEKEIKKRQLWFNLEKHLKEKGCLATNEDWGGKNIDKYYITFDYRDEKIKCFVVFDCKENTIYSTDSEILKDYMNTLTEEDVKIMFDVE